MRQSAGLGGGLSHEERCRVQSSAGRRTLLAQLAEECSEAAKAALKLRRARDGVNPTPVSEEEAFGNLVEELADIYLCSIVLFGGELDDDDPCNMCDDVGDNMVEIMEQKLARWKYRLMKKEAPNGPEE